MILERSMHPQWLSNTYLVAAGPGSDGFLQQSDPTEASDGPLKCTNSASGSHNRTEGL